MLIRFVTSNMTFVGMLKIVMLAEVQHVAEHTSE